MEGLPGISPGEPGVGFNKEPRDYAQGYARFWTEERRTRKSCEILCGTRDTEFFGVRRSIFIPVSGMQGEHGRKVISLLRNVRNIKQLKICFAALRYLANNAFCVFQISRN